jgi:pimeloyl-ACP methyl ester carboxylesterase
MPAAKTNGITTYYEIFGNGPPLVLIHGVSFDHKMWQPQISYFSIFKGMNPEAKDFFRNAKLEYKEEEFLKLFDCFYDFDLTAELSKITAPTLIIVGEREKLGFPQAEKMHELIEHSNIVKIPDAIHITNIENPEHFNRAVEEFFKGGGN